MRNPWDGKYRVSCDWTCHVTRIPPSGGGTDYAMNVGTPIIAAFDGVLTNRPPVQYPASGNVAILTRADGLAFYHLHLSQFVNPGSVREGDIIGYSGGAAGAPGSGSSTGPHVHVNAYYNGAIHDVHDFYTTTTTSANPGATPIGEDELMAFTEQYFKELGQAIIDQTVAKLAGQNGTTLATIREDIGYRDSALAAIKSAIPTAGGTVDLAPILAEIKALPAETVAAIKAAL